MKCIRNPIFHVTCLILLVCFTSFVVGDPLTLNPTYSGTYQDSVTGDNVTCSEGGSPSPNSPCTSTTGWTVDPGADNHSADLYERPTSQTFTLSAQDEYYAIEYLGYLDITQGQYGSDSTYMYFSISVYSQSLYKSDGTLDSGVFGSGTEYGIRIGSSADGAGGLLLRTRYLSGVNDGANFDHSETSGFRDTNGDVGTNPTGNGYDLQVIDKTDLLLSRFTLNFDGSATIELAFNYALWNVANPTNQITPAMLAYLQFETNRGTKDPANYEWRYKWTDLEAGSPYNDGNGPPQKVYELDTLSVSVVPEPYPLLLLGIGLISVGYHSRSWNR